MYLRVPAAILIATAIIAITPINMRAKPQDKIPLTSLASTQSILSSALALMEDMMAPAVNMFKGTLVKYEMSTLSRTITVKALGKRIVPTPSNFGQYLRDTMEGSRDPSVDMWGTPYVFRRAGKVGTIVSYGPDRKSGTPDDILQEVQLP